MYFAIVLMCGISFGQPSCIEAHDNYGPYKTLEECQARTKVMERDIYMMAPDTKLTQQKCTKADISAT